MLVFSDIMKMSDQIRQIQKSAGSSFTRLLLQGSEGEPLYMLKPGMLLVLKFINERILFELPNVKYIANAQWIGVRIRIATSMINHAVDTGVINKSIACVYHERLTSRVREILGKIYVEDLPFLG